MGHNDRIPAKYNVADCSLAGGPRLVLVRVVARASPRVCPALSPARTAVLAAPPAAALLCQPDHRLPAQGAAGEPGLVSHYVDFFAVISRYWHTSRMLQVVI